MYPETGFDEFKTSEMVTGLLEDSVWKSLKESAKQVLSVY